MAIHTNVDTNEIEKFSAIASRWWDPDGEFKPLHQINPLRLSYIEEASEGLFGKQVLDVGCGGGILAESMARKGAIVDAIDMAGESLEIAKLHSLESGVDVNYRMITAEEHAAQHPQKYDVVTCMEMLEHVPEPGSIIQACSEMVKPGGLVFFSTLNRNIKSYLLAIVGAEYILGLVPKGTHDHAKFIKPAELLHWVDQTALSCKDMIGLHMNPLSGQFYLSDQNLDVNYLLYCQR